MIATKRSAFMLARLTDNPIARAELASLKRQGSVRWRRARFLLFTFALVAAVTPLWLYMDMSQSAALLIVAIMVYLAHISVGMRTLLLAIDSIGRERRSGAWDTLLLTGIDARKIVWGKWWAVVRCVWKDHALLALPRVGLAFGLAQYLHVSYISPASILGGPFRYFSFNYPAPGYLNPQFITSMVGAVVIVGFAAFEAGLITALGLSSLLHTRPHAITSVGTVIVQKTLLVVTAAIIIKLPFGYFSWFSTYQPFLKIHCEISATCEWDDRWWTNREISSELISVARTIARVTDTVQLSVSPLFDNGTLLAANIMRPVGEGSNFGVIYEQVGEEWKPVFKGNLLFVLRNVVAAVLGLVLYAVIIRGVLRLAQGAAVRRHGALRAVGK